MDWASVSESIDLGSILLRVKPKTMQIVHIWLSPLEYIMVVAEPGYTPTDRRKLAMNKLTANELAANQLTAN